MLMETIVRQTTIQFKHARTIYKDRPLVERCCVSSQIAKLVINAENMPSNSWVYLKLHLHKHLLYEFVDK